MAQVVSYFEDDIVYEEGPFVIVEVHGWRHSWRIECEIKGNKCPALPDTSIYPIMEGLGLGGKTHNRELAARVCDGLNEMVKAGCIVLDNRSWVSIDSPIPKG